ncbi:MAG: DUF3726 domain-containing protein [bacterium]|nr:DUF3726 domain-containing protein [bacterium]
MATSPALLSLNEILFHLSRAAAGAGAPVGICEEFADTAAWLAFIDMDPARAALPALDALARTESSGDLVIRDNRVACPDGRTVSAIFAGPVVTDRLAMAPAEPMTLQVEEVDVPLLLAGAVAAAGSGHVRLSWRRGAEAVIDVAGNMVAVKGDTTRGRAAVTVVANAPGAAVPSGVPLYAIDEGRQAALDHGIAADGAAWSGVLAYYGKTLVPSTERSRSEGAGPADGT